MLEFSADLTQNPMCKGWVISRQNDAACAIRGPLYITIFIIRTFRCSSAIGSYECHITIIIVGHAIRDLPHQRDVIKRSTIAVFLVSAHYGNGCHSFGGFVGDDRY